MALGQFVKQRTTLSSDSRSTEHAKKLQTTAEKYVRFEEDPKGREVEGVVWGLFVKQRTAQ